MNPQTEKELMKLLITMNKNLVAIGTSVKRLEEMINKLQDTHEEEHNGNESVESRLLTPEDIIKLSRR